MNGRPTLSVPPLTPSRIRPMTRLFTALPAAALVTLAGLAAPASAQDQVAIRAGKIHTLSDGVIENAVILIENGVITAVGKDVEVPWNAKVVDAKEHVVMPTWILAHASGGMSGSNEQMANVPFLTVLDAIDPSSTWFEECLRNGVGAMHVIPGNNTLLGGKGMIVRPFGKTVEDMTIRDRGGMKVSLDAPRGTSRMAQIRKLRNALQDGMDAKADLERQKAEFAKEKEAGATDKDEFDGELDDMKKPVVDLIDGKVTGFLYVPSAAEIPEVQRLRETYPDMKLVLVLGGRTWKAADRIAALGLPVVLDDGAIEVVERDPETGDEETVCPPKVLADAGVEFAISISDNTGATSRYPWWQMASMIRHGVDRETAIRSLSTVPAKILGLEGQFGTVAVGKVANLQVLTGDPIQATTWVDTVLLEGEVVYERSKDPRLQLLFGDNAGGTETGGAEK